LKALLQIAYFMTALEIIWENPERDSLILFRWAFRAWRLRLDYELYFNKDPHTGKLIKKFNWVLWIGPKGRGSIFKARY